MLESLYKQSCQDFEVILVDQNPINYLTRIVLDAQQFGLSLRHLKLDMPSQFQARTLGLNSATGGLVGFPDDDCWYEPDTVENVIREFDDENIDAIIARWMERGDSGTKRQLYWQDQVDFRGPGASMITQFYRTQIVREIGGFDPRLGLGCWFGGGEDTDLWFSISRAGKVGVMAPSVRVHHPFHKEIEINEKALKNIRGRARGTGALYAKHAFPLWVVIRGALSPVLKALIRSSQRQPLAIALQITIGRIEGYLKWRRLN